MPEAVPQRQGVSTTRAPVPAPPPRSYGRAVTLRLVLAEDDYLLREGLRGMLAAEEDIAVVATCSDLDGLRAAVEEHGPDVVVTDIRMPPTNTDEGIRAATELRGTSPGTGVVVLSQFDDPAFAVALLGEGSAGRAYLLKERVSDLDQLLGAVRTVASGGSYIDPVVVEGLVASRRQDRRSALHDLTEREREVLAQMAEGKDNAAIAVALHLTVRGVERHINALFAKLQLSEERDVHRRVKAVLLYLSET